MSEILSEKKQNVKEHAWYDNNKSHHLSSAYYVPGDMLCAFLALF